MANMCNADLADSSGAERPVRTGIAGLFKTYSLFHDPAGYRSYTEKHHRFHENRSPAWYSSIVAKFEGRSSVLDVGCGPGLFLESLKAAGIPQVIGLERDFEFLSICRSKGLSVYEHDLNEPFSFIDSESIDGVVIHQALDYLSPFSIRTVLRECSRVLNTGGLLNVAARTDGQLSGDLTRSVPLTPELLRRLLEEAGFRCDDMEVGERTVRVTTIEVGGRSLSAEADFDSAWTSERWETERRGLYRVKGGRLIAEPGAADERHSLSQSVTIERELQCSLRLVPEFPTRGAVLLSIRSDHSRLDVTIDGRGQCTVDDEVLVAPAETGEPVSLCLRILRTWSTEAEFTLSIWRGTHRVAHLHRCLGFAPELLRVQVAVPAGEPSLIIDHLDLWQPSVVRAEPYGDAHMYMGLCRSEDPLLPDVAPGDFQLLLKDNEIGRALVVPYGSTRALDSYDQIAALAVKSPGQIYPLCRCRTTAPALDEDLDFQLHQLELLWQTGLLYGIKVHMNEGEIPGEQVLQWIEQHQVLTMWHVTSMQDLCWLEENVLRHYTFPVLLSHFGGYPLDRKRYSLSIDVLDRFPQLYLVTSCVWFAHYLEKAIKQAPHQVLFGSDSPTINPSAARASVLQLAVPEESKTLVLSENLRFITERVQWHRWDALQRQKELMFPPLPTDGADLHQQGFKIIEPKEFPHEEFDDAKGFWQGYEIKQWYKQYKPWANLLASLIRDLKPKSVLEFGCNVGRNLAYMAEAAPDVRFTGIDVNPEAIRLGREHTGLDLRHGDERTLLELDEAEYDLVFTVSVLDHISDIAAVCNSLIRCSAKYVYCLEVSLPVEGKVVQHFDHKAGCVRPSTGASYSWHVDKYLSKHPRVWRLDARPCYLHAASLGPYYQSYLAFLDDPDK